MIKIISQKVEHLTMGLPPGVLVCEFLMEEEIEGQVEQFYLTALYDDMDHFSTSKQSVYDFYVSEDDDAEPAELIEEYSSLRQTKKSKYHEYFKMADKLVDEFIAEKGLV